MNIRASAPGIVFNIKYLPQSFFINSFLIVLLFKLKNLVGAVFTLIFLESLLRYLYLFNIKSINSFLDISFLCFVKLLNMV